MIFREILKESAVGQRGRTTETDAENHLSDNPDTIKQFKKIVQKMGGKSVAQKILSGWNPDSKDVISEEPKKIRKELDGDNDTDYEYGDIGEKLKKVNETIVQTEIIEILKHLKDSGFKIKSNEKTSRGIELEFFKDAQAKSAFEDLKTLGLKTHFNLEHNFIILS